jgi:thiamine biosynthesis lipoprotein
MSDALTTVRLRAMACDVTLSVAAPAPVAGPALAQARAVFARVEAACTRFDPGSPLMLANAQPQQWHVVGQECFDAVGEAWHAYRETAGLFDPRVLQTLLRLGYDRSLPFRTGQVSVTSAGVPSAGHGPARPSAVPVRSALPGHPTTTWRPGFDAGRTAVRLGPDPIDLGGIGKGLAVRWAAQRLAVTGAPFLVEAGGDCCVGGGGPDGSGWRVGVEDPAPAAASDDLVAVLRLVDTGCATSSVRVRTWQVDGRPVHHLIDPRTGDSSHAGLRAVTVVAPDPAEAETWSKALFVAGRDGIAELSARRGLAALWIDEEGTIGMTPAIRPQVIWEAERVG